MKRLVSPNGMRNLEGIAIEDIGIEGLLLMERAALAVYAAVQKRNPQSVLVVCGPGNNGGDGLAVARMLHIAGVRVTLRLLVEPDELKGDARTNAGILEKLGLPMDGQMDEEFDVVVDAIFGTGLSRAPEGAFRKAIAAINQMRRHGAFVIAVDIPSGVDGQSGACPGVCVEADQTITFEWAKLGHCFYPGRGHSGQLLIEPIGIPRGPEHMYAAQVLEQADIAALLPPRPADAYKNTFGHGLLLAGSRGMAGAAVLCANAALSGGIGLLSCAAEEGSVAPVLQQAVPGAMVEHLRLDGSGIEQLRAAFKGKTALAMGPGLGQSPFVAAALKEMWEQALPLVVDADGLNALANENLGGRAVPAVLTPHPGEMARLLGRRVASPIDDAKQLAQALGCVVLLKGATTVIADANGHVRLQPGGCSALARGGSGDVLTGLILALLCQGMEAFDAASVASALHCEAARTLSTRTGSRGMPIIELSKSNFFEGLE